MIHTAPNVQQSGTHLPVPTRFTFLSETGLSLKIEALLLLQNVCNIQPISHLNCNRSLDSWKCDKLDHVDSIKYLGMIFDRDLRWNIRINQVVIILNTKILRLVYLAIVQSIISYGIVIWGNASKFALNPLIITLNSMLRFILTKSYDFHVYDLYSNFNVRNLNELYSQFYLIHPILIVYCRYVSLFLKKPSTIVDSEFFFLNFGSEKDVNLYKSRFGYFTFKPTCWLKRIQRPDINFGCDFDGIERRMTFKKNMHNAFPSATICYKVRIQPEKHNTYSLKFKY
ncbi:neuroblastoma-amplified sequence-like [Aphis craccivora]|uniref:Neuroblastoma-amplified sequence-like n=1 Tax=Aphis craccivora TaxID=307492 RepID=A0A6G0WC09_APHCR|nr:neuroblastoma-amplified sequence-like [Aphis craccivora]